MFEQVTDTIILDKEWVGETDARVHLFTKNLGRVVAKATGARKTASRLNAHLEPLLVSTVRLVQKNHLPQITDALRKEKLPVEHLPLLRLARALAPEGEADLFLWELIRVPLKISPSSDDRKIMIHSVLARLGYDPRFARCERCGLPPTHFSLNIASFYCVRDLPRGLPGVEDYVMLDDTGL